MAEVTAMRNNALPYPVYGVGFTVVFPILDADGDPVTGAASLDSEKSLNGDTFADCTNEATEIATSSGIYYLTLTGAETTADVVGVIVKTATAGAKTTVLALYPRKLAALTSGTCQGSTGTGDIQFASGDSAVDDIYNGCLCVAVIDGVTEARVISDYVGSTKTATISPAWNTAQPDSNDTYTVYMPEGRSVTAANVTAINNVATTSVTTINANQGTTQPENFTGTGASALVKVDLVDIAGAAVNTASAQLGVNIVNISGITSVGAAGYVGIDWNNIANKTVVANLSATTINLVNTVTTYTGNTPQTGDMYAAGVIQAGTAQAGAAGSITLQTTASTTPDLYRDAIVHTISGTGAGQTRRITTYSSGRVASIFPNWATNPDNTTVYAVLPAANYGVSLLYINDAAVSATTAQLGVNCVNWKNTAIPSPVQTGIPIVDVGYWNSVVVTGMPMPTYTQPTGFLAATFPSGTIASTTNITAATGIDVSKWGTVAVTGMPMPTYVQPTGFLAATFPSGTISNTTNITAATGIDVTKWLGTSVSTPTVAGIPNVNVKTWNDLFTVALPLCPTAPGRNLDVSATGGAGIDWGNVENQLTSVSLDNTRVGVVSEAAAVTQVSVGAITSVSFATGAITDAAIAVPAEAAGRPTTVLGMLRRIFEWMGNKRTRDRSTGTVLLRNAADGATLETQTQSTAVSVDTQTKGV